MSDFLASRPSVVFALFTDQQSAEFLGMIPDLLTAMSDQNDDALWQIFHRAYALGRQHGIQLSVRKEQHVAAN